jgi:dTDP-4-amino-4,6-dideoxygalactose transaminase
VIAVHLFGQPADMAPLRSFASRHGLWLFEDAAQAHGARYDGRRVGGLADAAAFSFYPTKNLGALGDGGAVTTDNYVLADRVRLLRTYGWRDRGNSELKGVNSRLDEVQAAFLRVKLARLDSGNARRAELADLYRQGLAHEDVGLPHTLARVDPVWHLFVVRSAARDELRARLSALGVGTSVHYQPLPHLNQAFRADGWRPGSFPCAERLAEASVSLPLHPRLSSEALYYVVSALSRVAT